MTSEDSAPPTVTDVRVAIPQPRRTGRRPTRERLIEAAVELVSESGWSGVTMSRLADRAGVSRQTVYNELGAKPELANTLVTREVEWFLGCVAAAFDDVESPAAGFRRATRAVLERAGTNELLRAVASGAHGIDTGLLPGVLGPTESLLPTTCEVVTERLSRFALVDRAADGRAAAVDGLVRILLSQAMTWGTGGAARTSSGGPADPARHASRLGELASRMLPTG